MSHQPLKKKQGYTLIELLITVTIMALFFGISLANHSRFTEEKKVSTDTQKFMDLMTLARQKALASDTGTTCSGEFLGYSLVVNPTSYELHARCQLDSPLIKATNFSSAIQSTTAQTINFDALTAKSSASCVQIKNNNINLCYRVQVNPVGIISSDACSSCSSSCCP